MNEVGKSHDTLRNTLLGDTTARGILELVARILVLRNLAPTVENVGSVLVEVAEKTARFQEAYETHEAFQKIVNERVLQGLLAGAA